MPAGHKEKERTNQVMRRFVAGLLLAGMALLGAACGPGHHTHHAAAVASSIAANPTVSADKAAAHHIAQQVADVCFPKIGGTVQPTITAMFTEPHVIEQLLTHSGRHTFATCLGQHGINAANAEQCTANAARNAGFTLATKHGRDAFGQAAFDCLVHAEAA